MNNLIVLPILIPAFSGIVFILLRNHIKLQRHLSLYVTAITAAASLMLVQAVSHNGIQVLGMGGWAAPYGIVLVADMFASILVLTTSIVSFACIWFAFRSIGSGCEAYFFYPLVQFLITGVNGSFLTGDIFNLFVFFEVMLIASYVLIVLGGTKPQLRESIKYLLVNVVSSSLFVTGVAFLYRLTGTLNMAHLSERVAEAGQTGMLNVIAIFLLIVFSLKAALFLYIWLPDSYSAPPAVVVALFSALLSKVGIYVIFRIFTLIFYHQPAITHQLIGWMAGLTMVLGVIGALAYKDVKKILIYNIIVSVGFIVFGLAAATMSSLAGAVYYLAHDMIVKALLFLAGGAMIRMAGTSRLGAVGGFIQSHPLLGWTFFAGAVSLAGIPPLSGFPGKLLITQGGLEDGRYVLAGLGLLTSLLAFYSLIKVFMGVFWGEDKADTAVSDNRRPIRGFVLPCLFLLMFSILIGIGAEAMYPYVEKAAETLANPDLYIQAVLKE